MVLCKDIWCFVIVMVIVEQIVVCCFVDGLLMMWLLVMGSFWFFVDLFGLWCDDWLYVFVEIYDYCVCIGVIEVLVYDVEFCLIDCWLVLNEFWYLFYLLVFEVEGEMWMLFEVYWLNCLMLYCVVDFLMWWELVYVIVFDYVVVDVILVFYDGCWWLFYILVDCEFDKMSVLYVVFVD